MLSHLSFEPFLWLQDLLAEGSGGRWRMVMGWERGRQKRNAWGDSWDGDRCLDFSYRSRGLSEPPGSQSLL